MIWLGEFKYGGNGMEEEVMKDMTPRLVLDLGLRKATESSKKKNRYGLYECQYCGKEWEVLVKSIKTGNTRSCGCRKGYNSHGVGNNRFYGRWRSIHSRCNNPKNKAYKDYGGRGITVCDEWLSATSFVTWCEGTYIEGMTLDRIDNDKGYSPENCRWTTKTIQSINQRVGKNNKSGYVGVSWNNKNNNWMAKISWGDLFIYIGSFHTKEEAVLARDNYIIENNLPHKLSTDYKKETK